mmetsp:Transcript_17430/g.31487  ORF Transcript_17430/g.31487 Transcript_17430/m.31487 type:complete len:98 (-) Transcript_17430:10482-10775(-)
MGQRDRPPDNFLGYLGPALLPDADYAIYGWVGNTGVKFLMVLKENYETRSEDRIRQFLQGLEKLYQTTKLNPFHDPEVDFRSLKFDERLNKLTLELS